MGKNKDKAKEKKAKPGSSKELPVKKEAGAAKKRVVAEKRGAAASPGRVAELKAAESRESTPEVEALVQEIIARVADKWTMLVLEALEEHGVVRFTRLGTLVGGISQKMLTKTVRQMESDGLVARTVHPVIPPRVEYELTELGHSLGEAFCGVWEWAEKHHDAVVRARKAFRSDGEVLAKAAKV